MANAEQLAILKEGVKVWNKWREENSDVKIELEKIEVIGTNMTGVDLSYADLANSNLSANIFDKANLSESNLNGTTFLGSHLIETDLRKAGMVSTILRATNLESANLSRALLVGADLDGANLNNANLNNAIFGNTILRNLSLDNVHGLDTITHYSHSTLDISVFLQTKTLLPKAFTRACGWQDWMVKSMELQNPALTSGQVTDILYEVDSLRNASPIQFHNLFISHSRKDAAFINFIGKQLEQRNILYWLDVRDATAGPLEQIIIRAIHQNPTFLLVLSEHAVNSDWVEFEVKKARELEKKLGRHVLCPIALDDSWKECRWPERLKQQIVEYNILDFSKWQDSSIFAKQFERLIKGLDLFYKPT